MEGLYKRYEVGDETPVAFVGVHPLRWRQEWGQPQALFAPVDDCDQVYKVNAELLDALKELVDIIDDVTEHTPYTFDSFVTQPARIAIAKAEGNEQ